jgi:hypothetical protein
MECPHDWEFAGELNAEGWAVWCSLCGALGYRPRRDAEVEEIQHPRRKMFWDGCTEDNTETPCHKRQDGQHCNCWYDGGACCACGEGDRCPA